MVVKPWRPVFTLTANGNDITAAIKKGLKSLTLTDEAGMASDSLQVVLGGQGFALPPTGAELTLHLGYEGANRYMGIFVVDALDVSGPPDVLTIKALAAPFKSTTTYGALQAMKTRSFDSCTVGALVKTIAKEHGLTAAVSSALADVELDHIDQTNESDMNLLTRLAREMDAIAKAGGGRLIFVPQGEGTTATGKTLPSVSLVREDLATWRASISNRANYGRVVAVWRDKDAAEDQEVTVGDTDPTLRLRHTYPSAEAATRAAQGRYKSATRGESKLSLTMRGRVDIVAESRLTVSGVRSGINGEWSVTKVTHTLTDKLSTAVEAEVPN